MKRMILYIIVLTSIFFVGCEASKNAEYSSFSERKIDIAPGEICANGGSAILRGRDVNQNNTLDDFEILNSKSTYACQGEQGDRGPMGPTGGVGVSGSSCTLSSFTAFDINDADATAESGCPNGGMINTYTCTDNVTYNTYSCNSDPFPNTFNALTQTTPETPGANCPFGGVRIDTGIDQNQNNVLDSNEISNTVYLCT